MSGNIETSGSWTRLHGAFGNLRYMGKGTSGSSEWVKLITG